MNLVGLDVQTWMAIFLLMIVIFLGGIKRNDAYDPVMSIMAFNAGVSIMAANGMIPLWGLSIPALVIVVIAYSKWRVG